MSAIQERALDDAKEVMRTLEAAGWSVMTLNSAHGFLNEGERSSMVSITVDRKQPQEGIHEKFE